MKIGILIYPRCSMWSAMGPWELLNRANKAQEYFYGTKGENKRFEVEFITSDKNGVQTSFPYPIEIKNTIHKHKHYDLIIVPGFESEPEEVMAECNLVANWISQQYNKGVTIASICTGSMILAKAGLLSNKTATTHWLAKDFFECHFPGIELDLSKVIIDHGDIIMSGSATSFQNLVMLIIERYMGRTVAVGVSKIYLINFNKDRPDSYMDLVFGKNHNDKEIEDAQNYIKDHYCNKISLDEVAKNVSLSKRTFIRRFRNATNETPLNYIQRVKVEKAKHVLENERKTFEEISFMLGYEDVNAFRKVFVKFTGVTPMRYKARYQIDL